ncbi:Golgi complex subunit 8 [Seminavis robusta]|uniref:Conserved oligomeric Golgi complex subunit 8 n=1 Tax=Seminavis robusta TaxID=568900 RepID=A0A9N8HW88_9STRA|nr:Golgi complex subunit 8 [Seminavis robusta]|eukprot:Sro1615_g286170.1 Golgi complex subunit 8 (582) ;mRNA; f:7548-9411
MSFITGGHSDERVIAQAALDAADEQLQSLVASHAGTFVSVQRRGQALEAALKELLASVKNVASQMDTAQQSLEQDEDQEESLAALSERHRVRRRTLLQHSSLLELLELPSLMDACVRSNLYEEALSIATFANTLERRHTEKNVVVDRVIAQIRSRQSDLRRHLLFRLKGHVTMPQCLEVVTALRRLNSIDLESTGEENLDRVHKSMELRLQIDFLEARDAWLEATNASSNVAPIAKVPVGSSEQLLDTIERYRTRMFEVATQYNAIFRAQTKAPGGSTSLLSMWTSRRVHSFLTMLSGQMLMMEDAGALRDALEASVFFSTSMGRLGADFTAQLPPLFEARMQTLVEQAWKEVPLHLEETLKVCRDAGVAAPLVSHNVPPEASAAATVEGQPMAPPRSLMALPPLARVVNAILVGLNDLRRCLLPGIFTQLRGALEENIKEVRAILSANEKAVNSSTIRGEKRELREAASKMRTTFKDYVEPYLRGSLEMALGNFAAAEEHYEQLRKKQEESEKKAEEEKAAADAEKREAEESKEEEVVEGDAEETEQTPPPADTSADATTSNTPPAEVEDAGATNTDPQE